MGSACSLGLKNTKNPVPRNRGSQGLEIAFDQQGKQSYKGAQIGKSVFEEQDPKKESVLAREKRLKIGRHFLECEFICADLRANSFEQTSAWLRFLHEGQQTAMKRQRKNCKLPTPSTTSASSSPSIQASTVITSAFLNSSTEIWLAGIMVSGREKQLSKLIRRGAVESCDRWSAWKVRVDVHSIFQRGLYEKLQSYSPQCERLIAKDIGRAFPNQPYFRRVIPAETIGSPPLASQKKFEPTDPEGETSLLRVLRAIANYFPGFGYTQGMNLVVGFMLLVCGGSEEEAFWMFVRLATSEQFLVMGLYENHFPLIELAKVWFDEKLKQLLPAVHSHLCQILEVRYEEWFFQWALTLFLDKFPLAIVLRFWDFIIAGNSIFAFLKLSLAILLHMQELILSLNDHGEFHALFNSFQDEDTTTLVSDVGRILDAEKIIKIAKRINISWKFIVQMTSQHCDQKYSKSDGFRHSKSLDSCKDNRYTRYFRTADLQELEADINSSVNRKNEGLQKQLDDQNSLPQFPSQKVEGQEDEENVDYKRVENQPKIDNFPSPEDILHSSNNKVMGVEASSGIRIIDKKGNQSLRSVKNQLNQPVFMQPKRTFLPPLKVIKKQDLRDEPFSGLSAGLPNQNKKQPSLLPDQANSILSYFQPQEFQLSKNTIQLSSLISNTTQNKQFAQHNSFGILRQIDQQTSSFDEIPLRVMHLDELQRKASCQLVLPVSERSSSSASLPKIDESVLPVFFNQNQKEPIEKKKSTNLQHRKIIRSHSLKQQTYSEENQIGNDQNLTLAEPLVCTNYHLTSVENSNLQTPSIKDRATSFSNAFNTTQTSHALLAHLTELKQVIRLSPFKKNKQLEVLGELQQQNVEQDSSLVEGNRESQKKLSNVPTNFSNQSNKGKEKTLQNRLCESDFQKQRNHGDALLSSQGEIIFEIQRSFRFDSAKKQKRQSNKIIAQRRVLDNTEQPDQLVQNQDETSIQEFSEIEQTIVVRDDKMLEQFDQTLNVENDIKLDLNYQVNIPSVLSKSNSSAVIDQVRDHESYQYIPVRCDEKPVDDILKDGLKMISGLSPSIHESQNESDANQSKLNIQLGRQLSDQEIITVISPQRMNQKKEQHSLFALEKQSQALKRNSMSQFDNYSESLISKSSLSCSHISSAMTINLTTKVASSIPLDLKFNNNYFGSTISRHLSEIQEEMDPIQFKQKQIPVIIESEESARSKKEELYLPACQFRNREVSHDRVIDVEEADKIISFQSDVSYINSPKNTAVI